jgi:hypothetical protein
MFCACRSFGAGYGGDLQAWLVAVSGQFRQPLAVRTGWKASSTALDLKT